MNNYTEARGVVKEVEAGLKGRKVKNVQPISSLCLESLPCQGHGGGAKITYADGSSEKVECSTVAIGALEVYFFPERMNGKSKHFVSYITPEFAEELAQMKGNK